MIDVVIPNNNEEDFIAIAEKLGYNGLCFLYDFSDYLSKKKKFGDNKIKIHTGILADNKNLNKIKNVLEKQSFLSELKNEQTFIAVKSSYNDMNIIEKFKPNIIFSFEDNNKRDFIHQRASGLNHILCRSAKENDVIIGFSLSSILNAEDKYKVLGKIMQNIMLCRKFEVKTAIASFAQNSFGMRSPHDLASLFRTLGCKNPHILRNV